jgi:hypothetical protein
MISEFNEANCIFPATWNGLHRRDLRVVGTNLVPQFLRSACEREDNPATTALPRISERQASHNMTNAHLGTAVGSDKKGSG